MRRRKVSAQKPVDKRLYEMISVRRGPLFKLWRDPREKRIAVITPNKNRMLREMRNGIINTLEDYKQFEFEYSFVNGDNNLEKLGHVVDETLESQNYDAFITIGRGSTLITKSLSNSKGITTPIVFGGVLDPVGIGLVDSERYPGNQLTGVAAQKQDYETQIRMLFEIKPRTENVLIAYNPNTLAVSLEDIKTVKKLLRSYGAEAEIIHVGSVDEIQDKVPYYLTYVDTLFLFRDSTLVQHIDVLVEQCRKHEVCIYSSDLETVKRGAHMGFCGAESVLGIDTAKKGMEFFLSSNTVKKGWQNKSVSQVSWQGFVYINGRALMRNDFNINLSRVRWMQNTKII